MDMIYACFSFLFRDMKRNQVCRLPKKCMIIKFKMKFKKNAGI